MCAALQHPVAIRAWRPFVSMAAMLGAFAAAGRSVAREHSKPNPHRSRVGGAAWPVQCDLSPRLAQSYKAVTPEGMLENQSDESGKAGCTDGVLCR